MILNSDELFSFVFKGICGHDLPFAGCLTHIIFEGLISNVFLWHGLTIIPLHIKHRDGVIYDRSKIRGFRFNDAAFKTPGKKQ